MSLFSKEIRSFFNSITGYLVITVFLALNSLFLWIIEGNFNLLDSGYASIDGLFSISPWVFMFLIPAITMRMFADEKKAGTMEFLLTKPLTELQILAAKYFAALSLVIFSLLPTFLYCFTIYQLGDPVGNIDSGAAEGSYIGLFLLGAAYVAIGLFASSLTDNPIASFIFGALLSFIFYFGFDQIAELDIFGSADLLIYNLGINEHYLSISRGVIDSRDVLYFLGLIVFFGAMARLAIQSRKWDKKSRNADFIQFGLITLLVLVINIAGAFKFFRIDLTAEKRYTLSQSTIDLLDRIEDPMLFTVYLDGDLKTDLKRLQKETQQMLDEFRAYNGNIEYQFIDPNAREDREQLVQLLQSRGLAPTVVMSDDREGRSQKEVFPGAIAGYQDKETAVNLLQNQFGLSPAAQVNRSIQDLEYTLASSMRRLVVTERPLIGFTEGNGELARKYVASIAAQLSGSYRLDRFNIREFAVDSVTGEVSIVEQLRRINRFDLLIVAKPEVPFNELDKFFLDQYIMNGGKVMWLIDPVAADMDSLSRASEFMALPQYDALNISDMLFRYGVRINSVLLQDFVSAGVNDAREVRKWPYFPLIMPRVNHPITKDLNAIKLDFAGTIDTIYSPSVRKTQLLVSSEYSKAQEVPGIVSLRDLYSDKYPEQFNRQYLTAGVLLEGKFESIYRNRLVPKSLEAAGINLRDTSRWTQQIVIADGDIIRNQLNLVAPPSVMERGAPLKLGYDQFTGSQFGNGDFILNAVDYMLDDSGLIDVRSRELKIRLLNNAKVDDERPFWVVLNSAAPILFIILFGLGYTWNRKRKYAKKA
ncbi:MAG: gliding motility-associated ABC transporter substrate-binding protein GldG [Flavobacteriia bacterium]|nr:gliding motility-associated ABC transporter substrate-binding protein GldG [Flavobacteriia bacterium]